MQQIDSQSPTPVIGSDRKHVTGGHGDSTVVEVPPEIPPQSLMLSKDSTEEEDLDVAVSTVVEIPPEIPPESLMLSKDSTEVPPDFPPESFWLSKDAEFDWFDRNAFLERKESTKGNNSNSMNNNLNQIVNPSHSNSSSQRYSMTSKSKRGIIGLPKTQNTTYVDSKRRQCKPVNVRLFPMRSYSVGKAPVTVPVMEPSSPKVSCIGRVRSKRCRSRRKSSAQSIEPVRSASQRSGLLYRITSLFRSESRRRRKNGESSPGKMKVPAEYSVERKICVSVKPVNSEPATPCEPPALGSVIRFASGRRSENWGGSDDDVAGCDSLDSGVRRV